VNLGSNAGRLSFATVAGALTNFTGAEGDALLDVHAKYPDSPSLVRFMRLTVVSFSIIPMVAVALFASRVRGPHGRVDVSPVKRAWFLAFAASPALWMLDVVHFQYNGAVLAAALLTATAPLAVAIAAFFALVMAKHLFVYYVMGLGWAGLSRLFRRLDVRLVVTTLATLAAVVAVGFGPFVVAELQSHSPSGTAPSAMLAATTTVATIAERLFPVSRGLCHSYWAPNLYPLYNVVDRVLCQMLHQCRPTSVNTRGLQTLVDAADGANVAHLPSHSVLPSLTPGRTVMAGLVLLFALQLVRRRARRSGHAGGGLRCIFRVSRGHLMVASSAAFFLASWQVHEKALLTILVPATVLAVTSPNDGRCARRWATTRDLSLLTTLACMPLFFTPREVALKYLLLAAQRAGLHALVGASSAGARGARRSLTDRAEGLLMHVYVATSLWADINALRTDGKDSFAALMAHSAVGSMAVALAVGRAAVN
jgi:alpha-1,3-glucosyltransferase